MKQFTTEVFQEAVSLINQLRSGTLNDEEQSALVIRLDELLLELSIETIEVLKEELRTKSAKEVLPRILGGTSAAGGLWRFFQTEEAVNWNGQDGWRHNWRSLSSELFFFGEDIFGNQLTLRPDSEDVFLLNHENGELIDLLLAPATLLETVIQSGLDWIDFYAPSMLDVARAKLPDVPEGAHLHWTQPLILGGQQHIANTSIVDRVMHLRGHGKLWNQMRGLPPGTEIAIKPKT